jgi:hypothetical protein
MKNTYTRKRAQSVNQSRRSQSGAKAGANGIIYIEFVVFRAPCFLIIAIKSKTRAHSVLAVTGSRVRL